MEIGKSVSPISAPPSPLLDFPTAVPDFTKEGRVKTRSLKIEGCGTRAATRPPTVGMCGKFKSPRCKTGTRGTRPDSVRLLSRPSFDVPLHIRPELEPNDGFVALGIRT